jgi:hypothetical protein
MGFLEFKIYLFFRGAPIISQMSRKNPMQSISVIFVAGT